MAISELTKQTVVKDQELVAMYSTEECPDCQDTMGQFYDENDQLVRVCDNCGHVIMSPRSSYSDYDLGY